MSLRYLIDTDWAIHYLNGHPAIVTRLIICLKGGGKAADAVIVTRASAGQNQV